MLRTDGCASRSVCLSCRLLHLPFGGPYPPLQRSRDLDGMFQFRLEVVNRGAMHMLLGRHHLEIIERAVAVIAVLPPEPGSFPIGQRPVGLLPDQLVQVLPAVCWRRPRLPGFQYQITVAPAEGPEWHRVERLCALFELRLAHPAPKPAGPPQSFVRRDMAFREAEADSNVAAQAAGERAHQKLLRLLQIEELCDAANGVRGAAKDTRHS